MSKLSVILITKDEEEDLGRCLESVKNLADEIIIVDSGSKDRTLEIAEKYGAKVYERELDSFGKQRQFATDKAKGEWILSLDADEEIPPELAKEIKQAIKNAEFNGYLIPRRNIILGREIKHARWSPDEHIWLWRKEKGRWVGDIHEEVVVEGKVGKLRNAKIHYSHESISDFIKMLNHYTSLEAEDRFKKGARFSLWRTVFDPGFSFFRRYFYKKGFLDGWQGLALSLLMVFYRLTTWLKILELQKRTLAKKEK